MINILYIIVFYTFKYTSMPMLNINIPHIVQKILKIRRCARFFPRMRMHSNH